MEHMSDVSTNFIDIVLCVSLYTGDLTACGFTLKICLVGNVEGSYLSNSIS